MKITRLLHASVNTAAATDEAAHFYREVLGLAEEWRPDIPGVPGSWFALGDAQLHLIGLRSSDAAIDPSRHHVCLGVVDLDGAVAELTAAGIPFARSSQHHPERVVHQIFFTDPAGNTIELQEDSDS
jgi:catechol 2,3-dioxygenase-like lactoylglutathione lyase family enzyme